MKLVRRAPTSRAPAAGGVAVVVASAAAGEIIKAGNPPARRVGGLLKNHRLRFVADPPGRKSLRRVMPGGTRPRLHGDIRPKDKESWSRFWRDIQTKDIAHHFSLSPSTIHRRSDHILVKVGLRNKIELVFFMIARQPSAGAQP